ncbi:MAG: hypothetical protein ACTHNH_21190 [Mesorhizobium sp.]
MTVLRMPRAANDDAEFDYENDYCETDDFYAPVIGMAVEMVAAGRFGEDRPEDRLARRLAKRGATDMSDREMDILDERLSPLVELYWRDRAAFEVEFARRREPGFYNPPPIDDAQG